MAKATAYSHSHNVAAQYKRVQRRLANNSCVETGNHSHAQLALRTLDGDRVVDIIHIDSDAFWD